MKVLDLLSKMIPLHWHGRIRGRDTPWAVPSCVQWIPGDAEPWPESI